MAEWAPGLYVSPHVPQGSTYKINMRLMFPDATPPEAIAVNEADWMSFSGDFRERVVDQATRNNAEAGIKVLEEYLTRTDGSPAER